MAGLRREETPHMPTPLETCISRLKICQSAGVHWLLGRKLEVNGGACGEPSVLRGRTYDLVSRLEEHSLPFENATNVRQLPRGLAFDRLSVRAPGGDSTIVLL